MACEDEVTDLGPTATGSPVAISIAPDNRPSPAIRLKRNTCHNGFGDPERRT